MSDTVRIRRRAWINGALICDEVIEEPTTIDTEPIKDWLHEIFTRFDCANNLHVFEVEFLDEPNEDERFFRFGTDTTRMARPCPLEVAQVLQALPPSIQCPRCRKISFNPRDVVERYCGFCNNWHEALDQ
jgi:hypothetical protein